MFINVFLAEVTTWHKAKIFSVLLGVANDSLTLLLVCVYEFKCT